jgi:hypothetical protein
MKRAGWLLGLSAAWLCCEPKPPAPLPPDDASDAAVLDAGADAPGPEAALDAGPESLAAACLRAEERLRPGGVSARGCYGEDGYPLWIGPDQEQFAAQCLRWAEQMGWDIACLGKIRACAEVNLAVTGELCATDAAGLEELTK